MIEPTFEPTYVDEYKPIPHRSTWGELSANQLNEIKSRLIGFTSGPVIQRQNAQEGINFIDTLLSKQN